MLRKIISVKNVGRFINSAHSGVSQHLRNTLILGGNGFGKTTLCSVLRSAAINDPEIIIGRKRLGATDAPEVELLLDSGTAVFRNGSWSGANPPDFAVFDETFIADNVHAGSVVDIEQRRNLYRVIVGKEGVALALEEERLAEASRSKNTDIRTAERAVQSHVPTGMKLEDFVKLPTEADIDTKIAAQEKAIEAVKDAATLRSRAGLRPIQLPKVPESLESLLARTLEGIASDAQKMIAEHIKHQRMTSNAEQWLEVGTEHITEDRCPFCAQSLSGLDLIEAYRNVFSDTYRAMKKEIDQAIADIAADFGSEGIAALRKTIEDNEAGGDYWRRYCSLPTFDAPVDVIDAVSNVGGAALSRLKSKSATPQEAIASTADFGLAVDQLAAVRDAVDQYNVVIAAANREIEARKTMAASGDLKHEQATLTRLNAQKRRYDEKVAPLCDELTRLTAKKEKLDQEKAGVRAKLEEHTKKVIKPYEGRINKLLENFNAGFRLDQTKSAYPGGVASSTYQIVINNTGVDLGDSKTPNNRPSFKNTLSAGDRSTLALAVFIAHLERDTSLANKIVVFDDPFTSQDSFRRRQTVHEIKKLGDACKQLIVFSHDAIFLRQLRDKLTAAHCTVLQLNDHRHLGMKIIPCDLDGATKSRAATDLDDLQAYATTGAGEAQDIIRKMRVVLETYCRSTFSGSFAPDDRLGTIVEKIKKGGDQHPAAALVDELEPINEYTRVHHHGENPRDQAADMIDEAELTGFVRRTLRIVNNFQG